MLVAGTGMHPLCAALGRLGVPRAVHGAVAVPVPLPVRAGRRGRAHGDRASPARRREPRAWVWRSTPRCSGTCCCARSSAPSASTRRHARARLRRRVARCADRWRWQAADTLFVAGWCALLRVASRRRPAATRSVRSSPGARPMSPAGRRGCAGWRYAYPDGTPALRGVDLRHHARRVGGGGRRQRRRQVHPAAAPERAAAAQRGRGADRRSCR